MSAAIASRTVVVTHPNGLCLRGASAVAHLAGSFQSRIDIARNGRRVHATDVLQVLSLGAGQGTQLVLEASGPDADNALDAMQSLFVAKFNLAE